MGKKHLYVFNWNHKVYISTNKRALESFSKWMGGLVFPPKVFTNGTTTWNIPGIERGPLWAPVPVIDDDGRIEYENKSHDRRSSHREEPHTD